MTLVLFALMVFILAYNLETSLQLVGVHPAKLSSTYLSRIGMFFLRFPCACWHVRTGSLSPFRCGRERITPSLTSHFSVARASHPAISHFRSGNACSALSFPFGSWQPANSSHDFFPLLCLAGLLVNLFRNVGLGTKDPGFERDGRRPPQWRDELEDMIAGEWEWEEGKVSGVERPNTGRKVGGTDPADAVYNADYTRRAGREDRGVGVTKGVSPREQFLRWQEIPETKVIAHVPGEFIFIKIFLLLLQKKERKID